MAYITDDQAAALRQLLADRDRLAMEVGALTIHWFDELRRASLVVLQSEVNQRRIGETALRTLGFDPETEDLTIDLATGRVMRLVAGQWQPAE